MGVKPPARHSPRVFLLLSRCVGRSQSIVHHTRQRFSDYSQIVCAYMDLKNVKARSTAMLTTALPASIDESASSWDKALYAFLAEKERRSGSIRTVQSYSRMLSHFFGSLSKSPD